MSFKPDVTALLGSFNPAAPPPKIEPIPEGVPRPRWSVMIPTFNCAQYLRQTLESVLTQALSPEEMQIEVIDDCSTKDDPEAVVREIGKGRVIFHRKEKNEGATANFNTCIERSRGELVHILHGDDFVLPGFYSQIDDMASRYEDCALLATRSFFVDEGSIITGVTHRLKELEQGGNSYEQFVTGTALQFAGIVICRSFFERSGGFLCPLVHCADWEMWVRAITKGGGVVSTQVMAGYRIFEGNDTSRLVRTGENLRDILRLLLVLSGSIPDFPMVVALKHLLEFSLAQARALRVTGDYEAAAASEAVAGAVTEMLPRKKHDILWLLYGAANALRRRAEALESRVKR